MPSQLEIPGDGAVEQALMRLLIDLYPRFLLPPPEAFRPIITLSSLIHRHPQEMSSWPL